MWSATFQSGIIQFTEAVTLNYPAGVGSSSYRWDFPSTENAEGVVVGQAQSVESDLIIGLTAIGVVSNFPQGFTSDRAGWVDDEGYDFGAEAFLCGRVQIKAIAPGTIELAAGPNDEVGIANENNLLQLAFARVNISVVARKPFWVTSTEVLWHRGLSRHLAVYLTSFHWLLSS